jgi:2-oxoglutarate dehydrogenase E1 component
MERFLQMSDEDAAIVPDSKGGKESMQIQRSNWQIVNVTTPANYFHVLRRQVCRALRKLLEIFSTVLSHVSIRRKYTGVLTFGRAYHWCS